MSEQRQGRRPRSPRKRTRRGFWTTFAIPALVLALAVLLLSLPFGDDDPASLPASPVLPMPLTLRADGTVGAPASAFEFAQPRFAIDGDTLELILDGKLQRVRLYGVDAPERGQPCYDAATARLQQLIADSGRVLLHPGPRNDDGNRLLRYAFTETDQRSIDALLIREGLAAAWRRDGQLRDQLVALEALARDQGQGCLWASGGP